MDLFFASISQGIKRTLERKFDYSLPPTLASINKKLEQTYTEVAVVNQVDLDAVLRTLSNLYRSGNTQPLSTKNTKRAPWVLYQGQQARRIVDDSNYTTFVLNKLAKRRLSIMNPLIYVYLLYYDKSAPGNELIRKFIEDTVVGYTGKSTRGKRWINRDFVFSNNGTLGVIQRIRATGSVNEELAKLGFSGLLRSGKYMAEVVKTYYQTPSINVKEKIGLLKPFFELQGTNNVLYPEILPMTADVIITMAGASVSSSLQDIIRPFYLKHLGDPRIPGQRAKWSPVSEKAQLIFRQWISRLDLEMFFNVVERVAKDRVWRYRRKFWEAYLPYAENTWVALGIGARDIMWESSSRSLAEIKGFASLSGAMSDQSVFMLEMKGFVFIEWSHSGKLRVWKKGNCPLEFGSSTYTGQQIRSLCYEEWTHNSSEKYRWQASVANWIKQNCGVSPSQSYYL